MPDDGRPNETRTMTRYTIETLEDEADAAIDRAKEEHRRNRMSAAFRREAKRLRDDREYERRYGAKK